MMAHDFRVTTFTTQAVLLLGLVSGCSSQLPNEADGADEAVSGLRGRVVGVSDGDTITLLDESKQQHKIRLEGIDAPEAHQAFGARAKQELSIRVFGKDVRVDVKGRDKYDRELGHVYVSERWINRELVATGFAWHYKKYSTSADLASAEVQARTLKAGLWADPSPVAPWDFRHSSEAALKGLAVPVPAPTANGTTVFVTQTGTKYHAANCRFLAKSAIPISLDDANRRYTPCGVCNPAVTATDPAIVAPSATATSLRSTTQPDAAATLNDPIVYVTKTGTKFHAAGCRSLSRSMIPMKLSEAKRRYGPCSVCVP